MTSAEYLSQLNTFVGSPTFTRDKANSLYISEVQTSPYKPVL